MSEPNLPLVERIARAILAQLATITVENGYAFDLGEIVRPKRTGTNFTPKDLGCCVLQNKPAFVDGTVGNPPAVEWTVPFQLDLVKAISDASEKPADYWLNLLMSEVNRAMMADPQWMVNAAGELDAAGEALAISTRLADVQYPAPSAGIEGVTLVYEVQYRVAENDFRVQV